jgi:glycosyltransferase involved in cell wall biosynthesis
MSGSFTREHAAPSGPRVVVLTDIATPYVVAVLNALAQICDLIVLFEAASGSRGQDWRLDHVVRFRYQVLGGRAIRRGSPDATDWYPTPRTLRAIARIRPQAVISGGFSFPSLYAAAYCAVTRTGLVIQSDGTRRSEAGFGLAQRLSRALLSRLARGALANSEAAAERFIELGFPPACVFRAPHATDMEPYWTVARSRCYERRDALRLLTVGRLIERKGVDRLLQAVQEARSRGAEIRLTIVGTGPEESALRTLAAKLGLADVRWRGFADQGELPALYREADAFAFPTLWDPFGIVLLEAAATGLPVVASPHAGATAELIRDDVSGVIVDPDDVPGMANALVRLAADPAARERMGRAAHAATLSRTAAAAAGGYLEAARAVM